LLKEKKIDIIDKNDTQMKEQTWKSVLTASVDYSVSQVTKEKQSIFIGCSTISILVFIVAFICTFMKNNGPLFYLMAVN